MCTNQQYQNKLDESLGELDFLDQGRSLTPLLSAECRALVKPKASESLPAPGSGHATTISWCFTYHGVLRVLGNVL